MTIFVSDPGGDTEQRSGLPHEGLSDIERKAVEQVYSSGAVQVRQESAVGDSCECHMTCR